MNGQIFLNNLPEIPSEKRNQLTIDAISDGTLIIEWTEVISTYKEHIAKFNITTDAAYAILDDGLRFRPQFSAKMAQQAADLVGGLLPTSKLIDLAYLQAFIKLDATILPPGPLMSFTSYSKKFNNLLEKKRANRVNLITDCGKAWILSNKIKYSSGAVNYGFLDKHAPYVNASGIRGWQVPAGTKHNSHHLDYSQVLILMGATCVVDNQIVNVSEIMSDPIYCNLISDENIIDNVRML